MELHDYTIIRYRPRLRSQILELQTHLWGANLKSNDEYLEWKYFLNPYNTEALIYVALHENEVVGMRGFYGTCWELAGGDTRFNCLSGADAVVHPDHRRRGLLTQMTAASLEDLATSGYGYFITLSAGAFTTSALMRLGWQSAGALQAIHRIGKTPTTLSERDHGLLCKLPRLAKMYTYLYRFQKKSWACPEQSNPFHSFDKSAKHDHLKKQYCISAGNVPRIEDMEELILRNTSNDGLIRHVRDRDFFAWRFQNPFCRYRYLYCDNGRLEGYLVLQAPRAFQKAKIAMVDYEATNATVWSNLVATATQWCDDHELMTWAATLSNDQKPVLQRHGFDAPKKAEKFLEDAFSPVVLVRPINPDILGTEWKLGNRQLLNLTNWNLRPIFSDNF